MTSSWPLEAERQAARIEACGQANRQDADYVDPADGNGDVTDATILRHDFRLEPASESPDASSFRRFSCSKCHQHHLVGCVILALGIGILVAERLGPATLR
jgi:hypothetical protein